MRGSEWVERIAEFPAMLLLILIGFTYKGYKRLKQKSEKKT